MKKLFISAVAIGLTLSQMSCNNAADTANNTTNEPATTTMEAPTTLEPTTTIEGTETATPATNAPTTSTSNKSEALNPPHGQPGHRCDIPEGAPLSTPPQQAAQHQPTMADPAAQVQTATPNAPNVNVQPQMPAQQTAPGFSGKPNPEHGQPGHRCDLQVGQILP